MKSNFKVAAFACIVSSQLLVKENLSYNHIDLKSSFLVFFCFSLFGTRSDLMNIFVG